MKFIAYYRVSTQKQGQSGLGLEAQEKDVRNFLSSQTGSELIAEFRDVESGKHNERKGLQEAFELQKKTGARIVIAKIDRLSRNAAFLFALRDSGCDFVCADMPEANTLTLGIMILLAQQERELISERTKKALAKKKEQGFKLGGKREHCFGDGTGESGRQKQRENADLRARKVFGIISAMRSAGSTYRSIAEALNSSGVQTARGGAWHASGVKNYFDRMQGSSVA